MATFTYTNNTGFTITDNLVQNQSVDVYGTLGTVTNVSVDLTGLITILAVIAAVNCE